MDKLGWIVVSNNTKLSGRRGKHSRSSAEQLPWASAWYLRRSHGSVAPTGAVSGEPKSFSWPIIFALLLIATAEAFLLSSIFWCDFSGHPDILARVVRIQRIGKALGEPFRPLTIYVKVP